MLVYHYMLTHRQPIFYLFESGIINQPAPRCSTIKETYTWL